MDLAPNSRMSKIVGEMLSLTDDLHKILQEDLERDDIEWLFSGHIEPIVRRVIRRCGPMAESLSKQSALDLMILCAHHRYALVNRDPDTAARWDLLLHEAVNDLRRLDNRAPLAA